jgi:hypothetical protein
MKKPLVEKWKRQGIREALGRVRRDGRTGHETVLRMNTVRTIEDMRTEKIGRLRPATGCVMSSTGSVNMTLGTARTLQEGYRYAEQVTIEIRSLNDVAMLKELLAEAEAAVVQALNSRRK